jgi:diacylglycerol kinase family enzyme
MPCGCGKARRAERPGRVASCRRPPRPANGWVRRQEAWSFFFSPFGDWYALLGATNRTTTTFSIPAIGPLPTRSSPRGGRASRPDAGGYTAAVTERAPGDGWLPASPARRAVLFVNPRSGHGAASATRLAEDAAGRGIDVVMMTPELELRGAVEDAVGRGADALGVAGGDGSLAPIAHAAAAHDLPFVCIPSGTRNHFAADVGVDRSDVLGALDAFTTGVERRIDIGDVNGRPFLNNVSLGVYADAVHSPEYRTAKARSFVTAAALELFRATDRTRELSLVDEHGRRYENPAIVLVSNNEYALPRGSGSRPSLDGGVLGVVVLHLEGPARFLTATGWRTQALTIDASPPVHAGIDGEPALLSPPIGFASRPSAVRIRIAERHATRPPKLLQGPRA